MSTTKTTSPTSGDSAARRLACFQCQGRKIKCERVFPCKQCENAGLKCQEGVRKPRRMPGSHIQRNAELRNRIDKLESMVQSMETTGRVEHPMVALQEVNAQSASETVANDQISAANRYVASEFWKALSSQVGEIRQALEEPYDDSFDETSIGTSPSSSFAERSSLPRPTGFDFVLCGPGRVFSIPGAPPELSSLLQSDLCDVYINYVEIAWELFHVPSLRAFVQGGSPYLGLEATAPENTALKSAILFAASSHVSEEVCQTRYAMSRTTLVEQTRRLADASFTQVDLFGIRDLAILQALQVYITTLRRVDTTHKSWALFGLAIRLARAGNIDHESPDETFYLRELRRRLWHHICVMDSFFALDRGSEISISATSFSRPLPSNVNDDDFGDDTSRPGPLRQRHSQASDMNYALMLEELFQAAHRTASAQSATSWQQRLALIASRNDAITAKYLQHCRAEIPFERYTLKTGECVKAINKLNVVCGKDQTSDMPRCSLSDPFVLELAADVLRKYHELWADPAFAIWSRLNWVPWQPLAILLAALCSMRGRPWANEAWNLVDKTIEVCEQQIADTSKGMLWQPLKKLHRRALAQRHFENDVEDQAPKSLNYGGFLTTALDGIDEVATAGAVQDMDLSADIDDWVSHCQEIYTRSWQQRWIPDEFSGKVPIHA